eukprot:PhM_4_TR16739/c1_g1_i1/m.30409
MIFKLSKSKVLHIIACVCTIVLIAIFTALCLHGLYGIVLYLPNSDSDWEVCSQKISIPILESEIPVPDIDKDDDDYKPMSHYRVYAVSSPTNPAYDDAERRCATASNCTVVLFLHGLFGSAGQGSAIARHVMGRASTASSHVFVYYTF